jgi:hypothetical protein
MSETVNTICDICHKKMNEHDKIWGMVFDIGYTYGENDGGISAHPEDGRVKYNVHFSCIKKLDIFGKGKLPVPYGL